MTDFKENFQTFMRLVNKLAHNRAILPEETTFVRQFSGIFSNQEANANDCIMREHFAIKFQTGPIGERLLDEGGEIIKEAGEVNGCQMEDVLEVVLSRLRRFNGAEGTDKELWPGVKPVPCRENAIAITKVEEAIMWLNRRTENRKRQGVEGTSLSHKP